MHHISRHSQPSIFPPPPSFPPDSCHKWRIVPSSVVQQLPRGSRWCCTDNATDPTHASCAAPEDPRAHDSDDDMYCNVSAILEERRASGRRVEFLVRWEGYGAEEDTWVAEKDMPNKELISVFRLQRKSETQQEGSGCASQRVQAARRRSVNRLRPTAKNTSPLPRWMLQSGAGPPEQASRCALPGSTARYPGQSWTHLGITAVTCRLHPFGSRLAQAPLRHSPAGCSAAARLMRSWFRVPTPPAGEDVRSSLKGHSGSHASCFGRREASKDLPSKPARRSKGLLRCRTAKCNFRSERCGRGSVWL